MPKFSIEYPTSHGVTDTYAKLKELLENTDALKKYDPKVECKFNDASHSCDLKGSQFKGDLKIASTGQGSQVQVTIDLPFILTPLKGTIQDSLTKMLKKHLG